MRQVAYARLRMNHPQAKVLLKRIEVAVAMQQIVIMLNAERRNQAINRLANANSLRAKGAIVMGCCHRKLCASGLQNGKQ